MYDQKRGERSYQEVANEETTGQYRKYDKVLKKLNLNYEKNV